MKLPFVLSLYLVAALAAPSSFAADAKPADKPAGKPAGPTVPKPQSLKWPKIKSWYEPGEDAGAIRAAKLLGRPIAIAWYVEGRPKGNVARWKGSDVARYLVGLSAVEKVIEITAEDKHKYTMTHPLVKQIYKGSGLDKFKAPCLFIGTWKGEYLGVIKREIASKNAVNEAARKIVKKYGKFLTTSQARSAWNGLMAARKLWHKGKYDAAMRYYRTVKLLADVNPRMEIAAELNKDAAAINHRGTEQLKAAEEQFTEGKLDKAGDSVRKIHNTYKGFETAKNAKTLFGKIRTARKESGIATKEIAKDPVADPPTRPAASDKPAANDEKKDDVHDDKKDDGDDNKKGDDEDGGYEEDF